MITVEQHTIIIHSDKATIEDKLEVEYAVERLINSGAQIIYIDLSKPVYLPSVLIGYLMWKKQNLHKSSKDIIITRLSTPLQKLFEEMRLIDFFGIR